jgi:3-hydroxymyristoyl/3-hydroxydecanoyl-(acyl carrier protein) dehydratase
MLAVNHPNVVLGSAQTKFLAPVTTGETMRAEATIKNMDSRKSEVNVDVTVDGKKVFTGTLQCYSLEKHVLDKIK